MQHQASISALRRAVSLHVVWSMKHSPLLVLPPSHARPSACSLQLHIAS
jgi:hypothetical protein